MKKLNRQIAMIAIPGTMLLAFQNCGKVAFQNVAQSSVADAAGSLDGSSSTDTLTTPEDVALKAQIKSSSSTTGKPSKFVSLSSPSSGSVSGFDAVSGAFVYTPKSHFFGADQLQFTEQNDGLKAPVIRTIIVNVGRTGQPSILSDVFNFSINTFDNAFVIKILDNEADDAAAYLSDNGAVAMMSTKNGSVSKSASAFLILQTKTSAELTRLNFTPVMEKVALVLK